MKKAGARAQLIDAALLRRWPLPQPDAGADKVARGDVLVVAGCVEMPGAALLSATAVLRAGAGRLQLAAARSTATALAVAMPEARVIAVAETRSGQIASKCVDQVRSELARCRALLVGPGMQRSSVAEQLLSAAAELGSRATAVLDAGALQLLGGRRKATAFDASRIIATPHAGEMAALWDCTVAEVRAQPLAVAREAVRRLGVTLVLKGTETYVVAADGSAFRNLAGNVGLATAGSGDVLAGIIAGLAARGASPIQAAVWGVHLHAKAGEALARSRGPLGYLARELAAEVPRLLASRRSSPLETSGQASDNGD